MLAAHRGRAKTMWSAEEKEANKDFFGGNLRPILDDDGMDYISDVVQDLTSKEMTDARKHLGHSNAILSTLHNLTEDFEWHYQSPEPVKLKASRLQASC